MPPDPIKPANDSAHRHLVESRKSLLREVQEAAGRLDGTNFTPEQVANMCPDQESLALHAHKLGRPDLAPPYDFVQLAKDLNADRSLPTVIENLTAAPLHASLEKAFGVFESEAARLFTISWEGTTREERFKALMKAPKIIAKVRDKNSPKGASRSLTQEELATALQRGQGNSYTRSDVNNVIKSKKNLGPWITGPMEEWGISKSWLSTGDGYFSILASDDPEIVEHLRILITCLQRPDADGAVLEMLAPDPGYGRYLADLAGYAGGHQLSILDSEVHRKLVTRVSAPQPLSLSEEERWSVITALSTAVASTPRHQDMLATLKVSLGGRVVKHDKILDTDADHEAWRIFCLLNRSWWPLDAEGTIPYPRLTNANIPDHLAHLLEQPSNAALLPGSATQWTKQMQLIWARVTDRKEIYSLNALQRLVLATALVPAMHPMMGHQPQWVPMANALAQVGLSPLPPIFPNIDMASPMGALQILM